MIIILMPLSLQELKQWPLLDQIQLRQGTENFFLSIFRKQGPYSLRTIEALRVFAQPSCEQVLTKLIQNFQKLKYFSNQMRQSDLAQILIQFFVEQKCLSSKDLIQLIDEVLSEQTYNSQIIKKYEMMEEYPNNLVLYVKIINELYEEKTKEIREKKLDQLKHIIQATTPQFPPFNEKQSLKEVKINSAQELKKLCCQFRIPLRQRYQNSLRPKPITFEQLFDTISSLGIEHERSREIIRKAVYPAFQMKFTKLARYIVLTASDKNIEKEIQKLYCYLLQKYQHYSTQFQVIVHQFYLNGESIEPINKEDENCRQAVQKITSVLKSLVSHLKNDFKFIQIQKIKRISSNIINNQDRLTYNQSLEILYISSTPPPMPQSNTKALQPQGSHIYSQTSQVRLFRQVSQLSPNPFPYEINMQNIPSFFNQKTQDQCLKLIQTLSLQYTNKPRNISKQSSKNTNLLRSIISNKQHLEMNPLKLAFIPHQSNTTRNLTVMAVYLSKMQIEQIFLKKLSQNIQRQSVKPKPIKFTNAKFKEIFINYSIFELDNQQPPYQLTFKLRKYFQNQQQQVEFTIDRHKILNNQYLMIINRDFDNEPMMNYALHFSLFAGIKFILRTLIGEMKYHSSIIFTYLRLFYDNYTLFNDAELVQLIIKQLQISKKQPIIHSKYILYLFQSLFKQNSLVYYINFQLYKKVTFQKQYLFNTPRQEYYSLIVLEEFHNIAQIIDIMIIHPRSLALVVNTVSLALKNQRSEHIYLLLHLVSFLAQPIAMLSLDNQIREIFLNKSNVTLTAIEYFNTKITYLLSSVRSKKEQFQNKYDLIMKFLQELIMISQKKKLNQTRGLHSVTNEEIQTIYLNIPGARGNWVSFISKLKKIHSLTKGSINLLKSIKNSYYYQMDRNEIVDYLKVLLKNPYTQFEKMQINKILDQKNFGQPQIKKVIEQILQDDITLYSQKDIKQFLANFIERRSLNAQQIDIMLCCLDLFAFEQLQQKKKKNQWVKMFFQQYLQNLKFVRSRINQNREQPEIYVKRYIQKIKYEPFKTLIFNKLLNEIQQGSSMQQVIMEPSQKVSPDVSQKKSMSKSIQKQNVNNPQNGLISKEQLRPVSSILPHKTNM